MKTTITLIALLMLTTVAIAQNPDVRPSIVIGVSGSFGSGDYKVQGLQQDSDSNNFGIGAGLNLPVSTSVTLNFGASFTTGTNESKANLVFVADEFDFTRVSLNFGVRVYFGSDVNKR